MKLTTLQLSFCLSLLVHGAAVSVLYVAKHVGADAKPASAIGDLGTIEILAEPELPVLSASEPQPVKIPKPVTEPIISQTVIPDAMPAFDAVEIAQQASPVTAEAPSAATSLNESQDAPLVAAAPATSSSMVSYLTNPKPAYPKEARKRKEQGLVVLGVTVTKTGDPADVCVIQSSGYALLDKSAQTAITRWQFVPARAGNVAINSQVQVPVRFRLSD